MMAAMSQDDVFVVQTMAGPAGKDRYVWHCPYAEAGSPLSRRLRSVQRHLTGLRLSDQSIAIAMSPSGPRFAARSRTALARQVSP